MPWGTRRQLTVPWGTQEIASQDAVWIDRGRMELIHVAQTIAIRVNQVAGSAMMPVSILSQQNNYKLPQKFLLCPVPEVI